MFGLKFSKNGLLHWLVAGLLGMNELITAHWENKMTEKYLRFRFFELIMGLALLFLAACNSQNSVAPSVTKALTKTSIPTMLSPTKTINPTATQTETPIPTATKTSVPTSTLAPTATSTSTPKIIPGPEIPNFFVIPSGNPLAEWGSIPVMAEAIAGQEEYGGYYFSVELPVDEVSQYYQQILSESRWNLTAVGVAENGSIKLLFQNDSNQITVTVFAIEFSYEDPLWGFQAPASFVLIVQ